MHEGIPRSWLYITGGYDVDDVDINAAPRPVLTAAAEQEASKGAQEERVLVEHNSAAQTAAGLPFKLPGKTPSHTATAITNLEKHTGTCETRAGTTPENRRRSRTHAPNPTAQRLPQTRQIRTARAAKQHGEAKARAGCHTEALKQKSAQAHRTVHVGL